MAAPAPNGKWETSKAVIGAADGTDISTEKDDADQPRRTDKYRLMLIKKL
jgi:hypothetical protein